MTEQELKHTLVFETEGGVKIEISGYNLENLKLVAEGIKKFI